MRRSSLFAGLCALLLACGDDGKQTLTPDAPMPPTPDAPTGEWQIGCRQALGAADSFDEPSDFGPATAGSLAGWNPDGRWFMTGTRVTGGASSVHFEKVGASVIVDRDPGSPATLDDTALFHRQSFSDGQVSYVFATRVSELAADGSLHVDRAVCDGGECRVCSALLVRADYADPMQADKLALLGEYSGASWEPGYTFNVRVAGTLAYVIRQDGLHIVETVDPAHPVELGSYKRPGDGYSNDIKLVEANGKRYALIADFPVDVVDVTNPALPTFVTNIPEEAHTLFVETREGQTWAYFGNYNATAAVYNVTDPAQPVKLGTFQSSGALVHDLSVSGGIAYLNSWDAGMQAVDFTTPSTPKLLGAFPSPTSSSHSSWTLTAGGRPIALSGDESWGAHLDVVDNDPASATYMQSIAKYKTRDHVSIHNIMAVGQKAYFSYYQDGIRVLDLSNPTEPVLAGYFNTWDPQADYTTSAFFEGAVGLDVDPVRKLVFVADSPRGLLILRDDTP